MVRGAPLDRSTALIALATLALAVIGGAPLAAGGGNESLTPGWDGFPGLSSGSVAWSIAPGSTTFEATFSLDGSDANQERQLGFHHIDATGRITIGSTAIKTGSGPPSEITREGHTSVVDSDEIGFLTTDANGDANQLVTLAGANPGLYAVQFHARQGGAPGCPTTSCNAIYRTGGAFADHLVRFAVPGAVAFWSGDEGATDALGAADLVWSGSEAYRGGHFRDGFDLGGNSSLSVPDPASHGLATVSSFTVFAWIESDTLVSTASIVNLRTPGNASGFTLEHQFQTPGTVLFAVNTTGVEEGFTTLSVPGFPAGQRIAVAASFEAATHRLRVYRDGALVAERDDATGTDMVLAGTETFEIGRNIRSGALFDGGIDELLYFGAALPPGTISALTFPDGLLIDGFESGGTKAWSTTAPGS